MAEWGGGLREVVPTSDSEAWRVTANALLANLRDALSALAPVAERARISWRDGEAYDDWDDLASCVYDVLVGRTIVADVSAGPEALPLAPYDMRLPSYAEHSAIAARADDGSVLFFNRLLAGDGDFAAAEVLSASLDGRLLEVGPAVLPIDSVSWLLLRRRGDGSTEFREHLIARP